ncbi:hypothetical protein AB0J28_50670, partial [Streptosporangium canum]|uniref:hypothetical protein n=1 Tax=Streptosporangium canum TaxID=324952 RepID=UPI00344A0038
MTERVADVVVVPVGTDGAVPAPVADFLAEAGVDVDVHAIGARLGPAEPGDVARVPILDGPDLVYVTVGDPRPGLAFDHVRAAAMAAARHCGSAQAVLDAIGFWEADPESEVDAAEG